MAEATSITDATVSAKTDAPPWPLIHFDVHCARCGHDLRGQAEPICPACKLEFSWEQAAPLEQLTCGKCDYHLYGLSDSRCPECGTSVDWNEAILRYRRREKPLFEYRWRDRPIRSFFGTWLLALRPRRLWEQITIHDPPRFLPLLFWMLSILAGVDILAICGIATTQWIMPWIVWNKWPGAYWLELPLEWASCVSNWSWHSPFLLFGLWSVCCLMSLMLYRQSMRIYKVRSVHVVRVWAYATAGFLPLAVLGYLPAFAIAEYYSSTGNWLRTLKFSWLYDTQPHFALMVLIHGTWSIAQGYRKYLRIPHWLGVAFVSQVMAGLAVIIIVYRFFLR